MTNKELSAQETGRVVDCEACEGKFLGCKKCHGAGIRAIVDVICPGCLEECWTFAGTLSPYCRECRNTHEQVVQPIRGTGFAAVNAAKTHCPRGHAYDAINTYSPRRGGRNSTGNTQPTPIESFREFGVVLQRVLGLTPKKKRLSPTWRVVIVALIVGVTIGLIAGTAISKPRTPRTPRLPTISRIIAVGETPQPVVILTTKTAKPSPAAQVSRGSVPDQIRANWATSSSREKAVRVASCETGGLFNPSIVNKSGKYRGLFQFDRPTWAEVGGSGDPAQASVAEQTQRAHTLWTRHAWARWPECGKR